MPSIRQYSLAGRDRDKATKTVDRDTCPGQSTSGAGNTKTATTHTKEGAMAENTTVDMQKHRI